MDKSESTLSAESSCNQTRWQVWSLRAALLAILLTATYTTSINVADPDLWGHVQYGRDVLQDGRIHETTTYSFTAVGFRWINHENLAEISLATLDMVFGPTGLLIFKFVLSAIVFGLVINHCQRQEIHLLVTAGIVLLLGNAISYFWSIRPQLFTFTYFALLIQLLNYSFRGWSDQWQMRKSTPEELEKYHQSGERPIEYSSSRMRMLWLAPVLFFLWANSHGGFVAGLALYIAYLGIRSIEALLRFGRPGFGLVRRFALMSSVAVMGTLINPYGPGLHEWLLQSLGQPRPEITEWAATNFLGENGWRFGLIVLVTFFSVSLSKKPKDFAHLALIGLTMWQAIEHHRHVPFCSILVAFWIPLHFQSALQRLKAISSSDEKQLSAKPVFVASLVCAIALGAAIFPRLTVIRVEKDKYPVAAFEFMKEHNLKGKMVVTYNWAQYAIAAFKQNQDVTGPGHISFDGRFRTCYPQQIVDMHFDFVCGNAGPDKRFRGPDSPPFDSSRILYFKNPDFVVISRRQKNSVHVMEQNRDHWTLLYQDKLAQVWGLKDVFDNPHDVRYFPPKLREISDEPQQGYAAWPAIKPTQNEKVNLAQAK